MKKEGIQTRKRKPKGSGGSKSKSSSSANSTNSSTSSAHLNPTQTTPLDGKRKQLYICISCQIDVEWHATIPSTTLIHFNAIVSFNFTLPTGYQYLNHNKYSKAWPKSSNSCMEDTHESNLHLSVSLPKSHFCV